MKVLTLSARGVAGIGDAVSVHRPNLVVVAGGHLDDDTVARWAYAIRLAVGALPVAVFRRGAQRTRVRGTGNTVLPSAAGEAQLRLLELTEQEAAGRGTGPLPAQGRYPGTRRLDAHAAGGF